MISTSNITFVNILQDYILLLQDILARQNGCSDFWDMKYDDMLSNNFYPTASEALRNLEHALDIAQGIYEYTDDMWFITMLKEHIAAYKLCIHEEE